MNTIFKDTNNNMCLSVSINLIKFKLKWLTLMLNDSIWKMSTANYQEKWQEILTFTWSVIKLLNLLTFKKIKKRSILSGKINRIHKWGANQLLRKTNNYFKCNNHLNSRTVLSKWPALYQLSTPSTIYKYFHLGKLNF